MLLTRSSQPLARLIRVLTTCSTAKVHPTVARLHAGLPRCGLTGAALMKDKLSKATRGARTNFTAGSTGFGGADAIPPVRSPAAGQSAHSPQASPRPHQHRHIPWTADIRRHQRSPVPPVRTRRRSRRRCSQPVKPLLAESHRRYRSAVEFVSKDYFETSTRRFELELFFDPTTSTRSAPWAARVLHCHLTVLRGIADVLRGSGPDDVGELSPSGPRSCNAPRRAESVVWSKIRDLDRVGDNQRSNLRQR